MSHNGATIGWREWVGLPALGIQWVEAKVDTGAQSSALHASDLEYFVRDGVDWVRFGVPHWNPDHHDEILTEAPLLDRRRIRSSNGHVSERPTIMTTARLGVRVEEIVLTLARRDEMGFRMLLGREALRGRFLVDTDRSFLLDRPPIVNGSNG